MCGGSILPALGEREVGVTTQWIRQGSCYMLRVNQPCIRKDLVDVRSVGAALVVLKLAPSVLVEVSEVSLVFASTT